jgi:hypothetical protein
MRSGGCLPPPFVKDREQVTVDHGTLSTVLGRVAMTHRICLRTLL